MRTRMAAIVAVCGGAAGLASAQPGVVTGSGATLQEGFFRSAASTNDFIDFDADGQSLAQGSFFVDQLATFGSTLAAIENSFLLLHYRPIGSGNGVVEFDLFNGAFDRSPDMNPSDMPGTSGDAPEAFVNRFDIIQQPGNVLVAPGDSDHLSGIPLLPDPANGFLGVQIEDSMTAGFTVDFATADVPLSWFTQAPGVPSPIRQPLTPGYGANPRIATDFDGNPLSTANDLAALSRLDPATVFEFPTALAPVAAIVNYGVGLQEIEQSDLRQLAATGRRINGENLTKVTRDSGSGTRNAFMNGIGLDPSWGVGENIGDESDDSANDLLGPNYTPSNKGGSSRMEGTLQNTRLGIGHTGASRGVTSGWIIDDDFDVLGIRADLLGGTAFVRPTNLATLGLDQSGSEVANPANAYPVLGPAALFTVGDPRNAAPELGGWGWEPDGPSMGVFTGAGPNGVLDSFDGSGNPVQVDGSGNVIPQGDDEFRDGDPFDGVQDTVSVTTGAGTFTVLSNNPFDGNPAPTNPFVSGYLNNIFRSIDLFVAIPDAPEVDFSPGEALASNFVLPNGGSVVPVLDGGAAPIPLVFNSGLNNDLQDALAANELDPLADPAFAEFDADNNGRVPFRTTGVEYTDGVSGSDAFYLAQDGTQLNYGVLLNDRNRIAGDFAFNFARDIDDIEAMLNAYNDRIGGPTWQGNQPVSIEIIGDFNGDGNFTAQDIRYFADGLLLTTTAGVDVDGDGSADATLNRFEAFAEVDRAAGVLGIQDEDASGGEGFFGITLANPGAVYEDGDAAADVAGSGNFTRGFQPIGWDRVVDAADIDYVVANFGEWTDLEEAVSIDLSADMNGDLVIDAADVDFVIGTALDTERGDFDLDGDRDGDDRETLLSNLGALGGYALGDFDLDGVVTPADRVAFDGACSTADIAPSNGSFGTVDGNDISAFVQAFLGGSGLADLAATGGSFGTLDGNDIAAFVQAFLAGCP